MILMIKKTISRCINKFVYEKQRVYKKLYYIRNYKLANPKINFDNIDKVLFVSHPDDEVIFFYKELITNIGFIVICITNGDHNVRLHEFVNSMKKLGLDYQIWDFEDGLYSVWNKGSIYKKINNILIKKEKWERILTHNDEGEYGHLQHKQLNRIIRDICSNENIYVPCKINNLINNENALSNEEKNKKINHMKIYYKSQGYIVDELEKYFEYEKIENA